MFTLSKIGWATKVVDYISNDMREKQGKDNVV